MVEMKLIKTSLNAEFGFTFVFPNSFFIFGIKKLVGYTRFFRYQGCVRNV